MPANTAAACKSPWTLVPSCAAGTTCLGLKCTPNGGVASYAQQCLTAEGLKTVMETQNKAGNNCVDAATAKTGNASNTKGIGSLFLFTMVTSAFHVVLHKIYF
jgi:hypothetical protein